MRNLTQKAFTLIELLVVIAIIGILSALIIVGVSSTTHKATVAKSQVFANSLRNSLMNDLVSEWRFDEGSGSSTTDSWGNTTGTLVGATHLPVWKTEAECISKTCLQFDSSEDYVNAGSVNVSGDYSIDAWVKIDSAAAGVTRRLIAWNANSYPNFNVIYGSLSRPLVYLNNSNYRYGSTNCADNKWHHWYFAVVGSGINDIQSAKIYIDGKEDTYGTNSVGELPVVPAGTVHIGRVAYSLIDNVRVYDSIISSSGVRAIYCFGLNRLFAKGEISSFDYRVRLAELSVDFARE